MLSSLLAATTVADVAMMVVMVQVAGVREDIDRLNREKVDMSSLEGYTGRVGTLFDQVRLGCLGMDCSSRYGASHLQMRPDWAHHAAVMVGILDKAYAFELKCRASALCTLDLRTGVWCTQ